MNMIATDIYPNETLDAAKRSGLPPEIVSNLIDMARDAWPRHPRYHGKAEFFLNIHQSLLDQTRQIKSLLEHLMDRPAIEAASSPQLVDIQALGNHVLSFAHSHHSIESQHYFPAIKRFAPQLVDAIDLMDLDHEAVDKTLNRFDSYLRLLASTAIDHRLLNSILLECGTMENLLKRHFHDEEEVIIPVFLIAG